jgi:hypothetical protein
MDTTVTGIGSVVVAELRAAGYMESTIGQYRKTIKALRCFAEGRGRSYTPSLGAAFAALTISARTGGDEVMWAAVGASGSAGDVRVAVGVVVADGGVTEGGDGGGASAGSGLVVVFTEGDVSGVVQGPSVDGGWAFIRAIHARGLEISRSACIHMRTRRSGSVCSALSSPQDPGV